VAALTRIFVGDQIERRAFRNQQSLRG
jgi:hypothetical protein